MKTITYTCNHCHNKIDEKDVRGPMDGDTHYCPGCYAEKQSFQNVAARLSKDLEDRWETGGLQLTRDGVVTIERISDFGETPPRFAAAVLTYQVLDVLAGDIICGPYSLESFHGQKDQYGEHGFNIFRDGKLVSIIRWRKRDKVQAGQPQHRWEIATYWDKDKPGELKWNMAEADNVQQEGEAVLLAIQDLEMNYDTWVNNMGAVRMTAARQ